MHLTLGSFVDSPIEQTREELKRILIHIIHQGQISHYKVQHGSSLGYRTVGFSACIDDLGCLFCFNESFINGNRSLLWELKCMDQLIVSQDIFGRFWYQFQDLAFQLTQLSFKISQLNHKLILLLLKFWLLVFDDVHKKLVLETFWCDCKVDKSHFNTDFWKIMWVW